MQVLCQPLGVTIIEPEVQSQVEMQGLLHALDVAVQRAIHFDLELVQCSATKSNCQREYECTLITFQARQSFCCRFDKLSSIRVIISGFRFREVFELLFGVDLGKKIYEAAKVKVARGARLAERQGCQAFYDVRHVTRGRLLLLSVA